MVLEGFLTVSLSFGWLESKFVLSRSGRQETFVYRVYGSTVLGREELLGSCVERIRSRNRKVQGKATEIGTVGFRMVNGVLVWDSSG